MSAAYDAAIVGGGPAGCSAAIALAREGARVVLFEARTYPHDKLCGEFLSPECAGMLQSLGLGPAVRGLRPIPIETVRLTAPGGAAWETRLPGPAWGLTRKALDAALAAQAEAAGVTVRSGAAVTAIQGDLEAGFALAIRGVSNQTRARTVIAAHGKRAALDRALGRRFLGRPQPFVGLKAHFRGPPLPGRIELHGFPGGYCGMSEIEGGAANVCLLVHAAVFRRAAKGAPNRIDAFIAWMQGRNARLGDWLARATRLDSRWITIGQIPFGDKRALVRDVLLAGDAAGLIAPLAGDGIAMALRGGQLAASACAGFLAGRLSPADLRRAYGPRWRREFGPRLRLARWLQAIALRPALLGPALRLMQLCPPLGDYLVQHTREVQTTP